MATNYQKKRNIKYLNRDFDSYKRDLIEHFKIYFGDTVQDFNESSIGMQLTELVAFMGDNLSYYLDRKVDESFLETAREKKNIFKHAKQLGFKAFGKTSAVGVVDGYIKVPAITTDALISPDLRYAGTIKRGAKLKSNSGETYETLVDADFSTSDVSIEVAERDSSTGQPKTYALRKEAIDVKAGETKTATFSIGAYAPFTKITISEDDVLEVLSVTDAEGNKWYEVDYLAQDTVFDGVANTSADAANVPYVLKLRSVPYRFVTEYNIDTNRMSLVFGTGDAQNFDGELIPDLGELALPLYGKDSFTDFFLDPQNFLKTRTMGLAPVNTTLYVSYRVGGGAKTNAGAGEVSTVSNSTFDVADSTLSTSVIKDIAGSFSVLNPRPVQGGKDEMTIDEIKSLVAANFAAQGRLVTAEDFVIRTLSMPAKFGSVFRAATKSSAINKNAVELIILSKDSNGYVTVAPLDLKKNIKTYLSRFRMMTDSIEELDGEIINLAVNFGVLSSPDFIKSEVLSNCIIALQEYFAIDRWQIGQPINLTSIYALLAAIPGVLSVIELKFINRVGNYDNRTYSNTQHNISENTENGIIYCKENAIFEIKFLGKDIIGSAR